MRRLVGIAAAIVLSTALRPFVTDLYQREIANAAELSEEVKAFLMTFNEVRPHETLGWRPPLALHREDPHLFQARSLQDA